MKPGQTIKSLASSTFVFADGSIKPDLKTMKYVRRILPRISGTNGGKVDIYVGGQTHLGDAISWKGPFQFTIGSDYKIDCRVTDRLISIRFETTANINWSMSGFDVDFSHFPADDVCDNRLKIFRQFFPGPAADDTCT